MQVVVSLARPVPCGRLLEPGDEFHPKAREPLHPAEGQNLASLPATVEQTTGKGGETAVRWLVASTAEMHLGTLVQGGFPHSLATAADHLPPGRPHLTREEVAVETEGPLRRVTQF